MYQRKVVISNQHQQNLDWAWLCFVISVIILPLFPAMGALGLFVILIRVWQCRFEQIIKNRFNWWLAIVAGLFLISSALAEYPQEAWLGLANFLPFFLLFIPLKILIQQPKQLRQLSWCLILPSLPIVLLGLGQIFAAWDTPQLLESILGWQLEPKGIPEGRMSAVFNYTNFLAIYLAIAFTLALGLWLDTWRTWRNQRSKKQTWTLLLLTLILLADISGLIITSSRNAWGLALISFLAYALYMGWGWLVGVVAGLASTILWASFAPSLGGEQLRKVVPAFFWARLSDQMYPDRPVETLRITQWQFCWDLIKERPLFGWGLRNFTPLYKAKMNFWFGHPHNLVLMLSAETGIIATLLLLGIVGKIMIQGMLLLIKKPFNSSGPIFFSYLVAFSCCILFNLADVTIFDLRVNTLGWILLSAIHGVVTSKSGN